MPADLFTEPWLVNTLLDQGFVNQKQGELAERPVPGALGDWLSAHFDADVLSKGNEAQLEDKFIGPLLEQLGWATVNQQSIVVQGKHAKPDWCLVLDAAAAQKLVVNADHRLITAICESKAWGKPLDTGKADRDSNPHHQLQDYLSTLRVRFGMLTNGRHWRLYDTEKITARKTYIEFDLAAICELDSASERHAALALFAFFFGRQTFVPPAVPGELTAIEQAIEESADFTLAVEENLKAVIYGYDGEDSLFEIMGRAIHRANPKAGMSEVYENSVVLLFRLLFVVYFEDKNRELLDRHPFYKRFSLGSIFANLRRMGPADESRHDGLFALKQLFTLLDEGAEDVDIPLFNGGLFEARRAPLLAQPKFMDNLRLKQILERLLFKTHRGNTLFDTKRDFKNMSVTHLGRIYEGLLEFRFERAAESGVYLEYESAQTKGKPVEAYFDNYDTAVIRKEKGFKALREINIKKGEVSLRSASNSRKTTASYYTPGSLSEPLVKAAVDRALESAASQGRGLMDLKILDNACGSGHFLVQALNYLTDLALERLSSDTALQALVHQESDKVAAQLALLNLEHQPDDAQILKRALLKRCIFGVDLNPFAVELARLSLWMDSFVFGTPLSFIEHHVQHGNALMGSSVREFISYNATEAQQNDLFVDNLSARFDELRGVMQELDAMRDTTAAEVEESKRLWAESISPKLKLLSRALSFICTRRVLLAEGQTQACDALSKTPDLLRDLFDESRIKTAALRQVEACARKYHFFHYEVAFPEAFSGQSPGFDTIVGNPPWDRTKFADTDFFPQYHSNYRSLKNTEKAAVQQRLLQSEHIAAAYAAAVAAAEAANEYYKDRAVFPLNKKSLGDGNLFRLFVERNLGLLRPGGNLSYVLPSALMFEEGSMDLRRHILSKCQLRFFYGFENRKPLFPDVDSRYKFASIQVLNTPPTEVDPPIDTAFYLLDPADLQRPEIHVPYPLATLKKLSPDQWALMELRNAQDLPILKKCYSAFAPLSKKWLDFRRELHMTDDKDLFIEEKSAGLLPLYEGKMIWQYSHIFEKPQYWLDQAAFDERMRSKELHRMAQDLGVPKAAVSRHAGQIRFDREYVRLAFRDVASDTNERTLIFSLVPKGIGAGNTLHLNVPKTYCVGATGSVDAVATSTLRLLFALAWFNSLPVDWLARFMIQIHANKTYLFRLPVPQPSDADILSNPAFSELARNALLLALASSWEDFSELAPVFNVTRQAVPSTPKALDQLRAQNDKIVARLYGIDATEFAHLLRSFKGLAIKRPEYVTLLQ